ncbi:MAG: dienelactone hydrolase family protein [Spirochaetia bacterium]|nr:dienelactone hydrolase family protein [Spirochaetia bacterium]
MNSTPSVKPQFSLKNLSFSFATLLAALLLVTSCKLPHFFKGQASVKTETIEYRQGSNTFEGFLAFDQKAMGKKPGVIIIPQAKGPAAVEKETARLLAGLGYTAFVVDVYGKSLHTGSNQDSSGANKPFRKNRKLLRERIHLGIASFTNRGGVDANRLAVIGYGFGGMGALDLARNSDALRGVVSFHGDLDSPNQKEIATNIRAKILILHGAEDPNVPEKEALAFQREMRAAEADWQMHYYGAARAFTQSETGTNATRHSAPNEKAAKRSWEALTAFLKEVLN